MIFIQEWPLVFFTIPSIHEEPNLALAPDEESDEENTPRMIANLNNLQAVLQVGACMRGLMIVT